MAKRTTGLWGARPSKQPKNSFAPPKQEDRPGLRKPHFEQQLCEAIRARKLVEIRYEDDLTFRVFAPYAVYNSTKDKVNVSGTQVSNPSQPLDRNEPRVFEVGKITAIRPTEIAFTPDHRFDRLDPRYKDGIICSV